ncbi:MAG: PAS domain-containing protein, partial [Clostridia bacterium]|nr:PAS domain-containing protein [Clostridia bacterium]
MNDQSALQQWLEETLGVSPLPEEALSPAVLPLLSALRSRLQDTEARLTQTEAALNFFKSATDAMPNPIFLKDESLRFLFFNRAYREFFSLKDDSYLGKRIFDLDYLSDEDRHRYHREDSAAVRNLSTLRYETSFDGPEGKPVDALYWTKGFEVEKNGQRGLVGEIVDISEQKRTQQELSATDRELSRQKLLFTVLVNGTSDIFVLFSAKNYQVEYVSPNIEILLGLSPDEVMQDIRKISETALNLDSEPLPGELASIPLGGSIKILNEHLHQRTGSHRWYLKTVYHFFLDNEDKYVLVMNERTAEMEAQQQLE